MREPPSRAPFLAAPGAPVFESASSCQSQPAARRALLPRKREARPILKRREARSQTGLRCRPSKAPTWACLRARAARHGGGRAVRAGGSAGHQVLPLLGIHILHRVAWNPAPAETLLNVPTHCAFLLAPPALHRPVRCLLRTGISKPPGTRCLLRIGSASTPWTSGASSDAGASASATWCR